MSEAAKSIAYTAPPIVQAVVQIVYADPLSEALYRKSVKKLGRSYDNQKDEQNVNANVDFANQKVNFSTDPQTTMSSHDQSDGLIVAMNALTWTRNAPYEGWEPFFARVERDLRAAHDVCGPRKLLRIGVRYINRLDVLRQEDGTSHYEDYIAINISLPREVETVMQYGWRFEHDLRDRPYRMVMQSASAPSEVPNTDAFIIDIDVIALIDLPTKIDDILIKLHDMRAIKNEGFEMAITDKARDSFSV